MNVIASLPRPTVTDDVGAPITALIYSNQGHTGFHWEPRQIQVVLDTADWRLGLLTLDAVQLELPLGWRCEGEAWRSATGESPVTWRVTPDGVPPAFAIIIEIVALSAAEEVGRANVHLPIEMRGYSQFDPQRDGLSVANRSSVLGHIGPDPQVFRQTYGFAPAAQTLFDGLYRSIVFIGGGGQGYRGGLCSGMARAALQRSLTGHGPEPSIKDVMLWHGRQLTDRALLASAPWFFAPSPRRAYEHFRAMVLADGTSDLCFDIAVPRPLRRDLATAIMEEGHTVVPYAFRQSDETRAQVQVYDPNHPEPEAAGESVITFDLVADRYAYRRLATLDDGSTTIIAVRQSAYARGRTAILASLASLLLTPRTLPSVLTRRPVQIALLLAFFLIGVVLARLRRSRRSDMQRDLAT